MAIERCSLCGGRLGSNGICTECGMDNTKNDKKYSLNKNLKLDFRQAEPSGKNTENSRGATGGGQSGDSRTYEQKPFEEQRRRPHTPPPYQGSAGRTYRGRRSEGNSGTAGKVVFVVVLLITIGAAVLGFMLDRGGEAGSYETEDLNGILDEEVDWQEIDEILANTDGSYTIYSEDGEHFADITMADGQTYCYAGEGYFSSMQEEHSGGEEWMYSYSFDEYTSLEEAYDSYIDVEWMEESGDYENITAAGAQEAEIDGQTIRWTQLDYIRNGTRCRELYLWTQKGDVLFTIRIDDSVYAEDQEPTGSLETLTEAWERVVLH